MKTKSGEDTNTAIEPRKRFEKTFTQPSLANQSMKDECDVNVIMRRYEQTGILQHVARVEGRYGDYIGYPDFQEAMNAVTEAQEMFMTLPASIRDRFGNSPEAFLAFAQDENNLEEMTRMGLLPSSVADAPAEPEQASASADAPAPAPASPEA